MLKKLKSFLFENTGTKQTVAKNTAWLSISNFGGRLIKAAIVIYGARVLGAAGWGVFSYAVTLAGFFTLFVDPGINAMLIREGSKASEEERFTLFSTTFVIKICALAASVLVVIFIAPFFSTLPGAKILLPLVALIIVFDGLREFFASLLRAMERMEWDAGAFLLTNLGIVIAGFLFLHFATTPDSLAWAYVAGTAIGAITAAIVIRKYFKKIVSSFSRSLVMPIILAAWPFAVMGILGALLTNTDIIIISWMRTAADVGIYSAAIRLVQLFYLVPGVLQFSTLPAFARFANDNVKFRAALERTVTLIFFVSIPLSLGGIILGTQVMGLIFGSAYIAGGLALSILMASMFFDFAGGIVSSAVFALNYQKKLIAASAIGGLSNLIFDLLLIPHFGIAGSAIATLIAQILSNSYLWYTMDKIRTFSVMRYLKKISAAGIGMALVTLLLLFAHVNVVINVLVSVGIYFLLLKVLNEPLLSEMKSILLPPVAV
jgi:O-antigen/teichoic acid export membrane protein